MNKKEKLLKLANIEKMYEEKIRLACNNQNDLNILFYELKVLRKFYSNPRKYKVFVKQINKC